MKALKKTLLVVFAAGVFLFCNSAFFKSVSDEFLESNPVEQTVENTGVTASPVSTDVPEIIEVTPEPTVEPVVETIPEPTPEPSPEPEAEELTSLVSAGYENDISSSYLYDNDYNTKCQLNNGKSIWIHCDTAFSSVYFVWYSAPGDYKLKYEDNENTISTGFMQQYFKLSSPVNDLTLTYGEGSQYLCDIRIFGAGSPPEDLPVWQSPSEDCDIMFFPTHSDDDCLFMGPMIAESIDKGLDVQVSFMCMHPQEPIRELERLQGLWRMGVTHYPTYGGFEDVRTYSRGDAEDKFNPSEVLKWQIENIRRFKPEILVGHDLYGEYGNDVHKINSESLMNAFDLASDESINADSTEKWGVWSPQKLYIHLYDENSFDIDLDKPLDAYDGKTAFEVSEAGFSAHLSQVQWGYEMIRDPASNEYCGGFGLAKTTVGLDTMPDVDITEHVTFS